jgi:5'-nucleotidase (lipoprotein e(P4) family)
MRTYVVLILLVASVACRSARSAPPAVAAPPPPGARASAILPDSIRWVQEAAEYQASLLQVYRLAAARVESEARSRAAGTWAVVLDADETVISNLEYQVERARQGLPYSSESWRAWVARREATPLAGAGGFLSRVRSLGGRIAIVTNRLQSECPDTEAVFQAHGLAYDVILCRADAGPSDKNPRFEAVAAGRTALGASPLDIVAFVGDNIQDFPGLRQTIKRQGDPAFAEFGVRYFVVPNPMYGSWQ